MNKMFLQELQELLVKYNAKIGFTCDPSSDTYGLSGDAIVVEINGGEEIYRTDGWWLTAGGMEEAISSNQ
jgi:hypothetical protein